LRTYLVFEPAGVGRSEESANATRFVREKFYWLALLFALPWLLWHRLWIALFGWLMALALLAGVAYALDLPPTAVVALMMLPSLVVAFEGSELRRRKLLRAGYRDAGVATGASLEEAERRFFAGWTPRADVRQPPAAPPPARDLPSAPPRSVIGLFPEPGGGR
jgi:hypothetical protein